MRILIYGINYAPEMTGIGKYTSEMCSWLSKNGHTIEVVTAMPYYPSWKIDSNYRCKWWHTEKINGVKINRCPLYVPKKNSSFKRILHEFSFLLSVFPVWFKILFLKKFDLVISISPPFHLEIYPLLYSKIRRSKLVTHIQDLQVDAAKDLGMIKNNFLLNLMFRTEKFLLKRSTAISTISPGMQMKIEAKGIVSSKIILFPNWVDEHQIKPLSKNQSLRKELGLKENDKVILYSGNLGEKQGLENIIEAAKHFSCSRDTYFILVGEGFAKKKIESKVNVEKLTNVKFFPLQVYEKLSALLAIADIHLVLEKKSISDLVMPSKLVSILSSGGCAIVTTVKGSTLYSLVADNKIGLLAEPDNIYELIKVIDFAINADLSIYRSNARQYAEKYFSKEVVMNNWEKEL